MKTIFSTHLLFLVCQPTAWVSNCKVIGFLFVNGIVSFATRFLTSTKNKFETSFICLATSIVVCIAFLLET